MIVVDVNVLVSAFHPAAPDHAAMRGWLEDAVNGADQVAASDAVLTGTLRVLTHPRVFDPPVPVGAALDVVDGFASHPRVTVLAPLPGHWARVRDLCRQVGARGNLVMDASHAVLAMEHGAVLVTKDRDFARFPGLRWRAP